MRRALRMWSSYALDIRRVIAPAERAARRLLQRDVAYAFESWSSFCNAAFTMLGAFTRLYHREASAAWAVWVRCCKEAHVARFVSTKLSQLGLARCFASWDEFAHLIHLTRARLLRCVSRLQQTGVVRAWACWVDAAAHSSLCKARIVSCLRQHVQAGLGRALYKWVQRARSARDASRLESLNSQVMATFLRLSLARGMTTSCALAHFLHRELSVGWSGWHKAYQAAEYRLLSVARLVQARLTRRRLGCWWIEWAAMARLRGALQRDVLRGVLLSGRRRCGAGLAIWRHAARWAQWRLVAQRVLPRASAHLTGVQRAHAWLEWRSWWLGGARARHMLRETIARWAERRLASGLARWAAGVAQHIASVRSLRASLGRWMRSKLRAGYATWVRVVHASASRQRVFRRGVAALSRRAEAAALMAWKTRHSEMVTERSWVANCYRLVTSRQLARSMALWMEHTAVAQARHCVAAIGQAIAAVQLSKALAAWANSSAQSRAWCQMREVALVVLGNVRSWQLMRGWRCWMRQTLLVQLECQLLQQLLATPGVLRRRLLRLWFRRMLVWGRARGQQRQAQVDAVRSLCNVALVRAWRTWCNGLAPMTTSPASTASATAVVIPATWGMGEAQGTGSGQVDKPRLAAPSTANTPSRTAPAGSWKTPSFLPRRLFGFGGSPGSGGGGIPVDPPPHYSPPPLMAIHA